VHIALISLAWKVNINAEERLFYMSFLQTSECVFSEIVHTPLGRDLSVTHPPLLIIEKLAHDFNTHHVPTECLNFWLTLKLWYVEKVCCTTYSF